jgi:hypothetical protein
MNTAGQRQSAAHFVEYVYSEVVCSDESSHVVCVVVMVTGGGGGGVCVLFLGG